MAAEDLIPALQASVGSYTTTVDGKQATIDAKMTAAQTAIDAARVSQAAAKTARAAAMASSNAAYRDVQSARANLAHQDLEALAQTKAGTFVDVFVYDTSKDSDGGAWRQRCAGTSWYQEPLNTSTRGARRDFPAVAVIVAEAAKITIYDGDDPALPMWKTLNDGLFFWDGYAGIDTIFAMQGKIAYGISYSSGISAVGLYIADFAADLLIVNAANDGGGKRGIHAPMNSGINGPLVKSGYVYSLVNYHINDIVMTVLPNAPIDPETGLQVPTIVLATAGGVNVIRADGTVVSSGTGAHVSVDIVGTRVFFQKSGAGDGTATADLQNIAAGFGTQIFDYLSGAVFPARLAASGNDLVIRADRGFFGLSRMMLNGSGAIVAEAHIRSSCNTGWMPGATRGAFLSSKDTTALVGGNLVTNGTFDTDINGWTTSVGLSATVANGQVTIANNTGFSSYSENIYQDISGLVVGNTYVLNYNYISGSNRVRLLIGSPYTQVYSNTATTVTFVATSTSTRLTFYLDGLSLGNSATIDNISVKLADADRSVNNKSLIVNGTITRTAVATGAELVGYSGFSAANYLEQPYNPSLDFGTGDFCVMGWGKRSLTGSGCILISKSPPGGAFGSPYFELQPNGSYITWVGNTASTKLISVSTFSTDWMHIAFVRKSGVASLYINGKVEASSVNTENYNHSNNDIVRFGTRQDGYFGVANQFMALWRISATAPTADQVQRIFEDEKVLFQENAACTLFGTSDAVTALAQDPDTGLLHVGTLAGRSSFDGLRRISNTTTAVTTAISAANGLVIEQ